MTRLISHSVLGVLLAAGLGSPAIAQTVEFRMYEMTGQSSTNLTTDAQLDFVIDARVVGGSATTGIASFDIDIFSWAGETAGTFARLRINNGDVSLYTGAPTTGTTGGGFAGVAYPFRQLVALDAANNGLINPPTSATGYTNTACIGELSGVHGQTGGTFLLRMVDSDGDGIPDTSPLNGTGQSVPDGSTAALDTSSANKFFGASGNWTQLYRFRYTQLPNSPSGANLTLTAQVRQTPMVFSQMQKTASGWQPVATPAAYSATNMIWINGFFGNPVNICPPDYNGQNGVNVQDLFDFLNAWFSNCNLSFCPRTADYNCSGVLDTQDIFDFLNDWFIGC